MRRLEDRVAGDRADSDLTEVGRDLDLATAVPRVALPYEARSHKSPVVSTSTGPNELLTRVAPRRPTVRTLPSAISAVSRDPVGSSTFTSTDSVGPNQLMRGRGPVMVSRWPSKSTLVSSAPRRSVAFSG